MAEETKPQRKSERLQHEVLVAYRTVNGFVTGWAVNISRGGMFVNTPTPSPMGTTLKLIISLPDAAFCCEVQGKVVRVLAHEPGSKDSPGMGIEFVEVDAGISERLERFVEKFRTEL